MNLCIKLWDPCLALRACPAIGHRALVFNGAARKCRARRSLATSSQSSPPSQLGESTGKQPHIPVLLDEVLETFSSCSLTRFADGTLGAGGHSAAILAAHPEVETYLGLDVDPVAHDLGSTRLKQVLTNMGRTPHLSFQRANYSQMLKAAEDCFDGKKADGILLDLGVSSMQLDSADRGFSLMQDGPLDMRMDDASYLTAELIVNTWSEHDLGQIFKDYGEERHWRAYARRVVERRSESPIRTTKQLVHALGRVGGSNRKNANKGVHPATRIFQALRIAVNVELDHLHKAIPPCIEALAPKGRLAVISFHSLEDRIVKRAFLEATGRSSNNSLYEYCTTTNCLGTIVTRKPITASEEEQTRNPRSRSAKLRVFEKLDST